LREISKKELYYIYYKKNSLLEQAKASIFLGTDCILSIRDKCGKSWIENPYLPNSDKQLNYTIMDSDDMFYYNLENFKSASLDLNLYINPFMGKNEHKNLLIQKTLE